MTKEEVSWQKKWSFGWDDVCLTERKFVGNGDEKDCAFDIDNPQVINHPDPSFFIFTEFLVFRVERIQKKIFLTPTSSQKKKLFWVWTTVYFSIFSASPPFPARNVKSSHILNDRRLIPCLPFCHSISFASLSQSTLDYFRIPVPEIGITSVCGLQNYTFLRRRRLPAVEKGSGWTETDFSPWRSDTDKGWFLFLGLPFHLEQKEWSGNDCICCMFHVIPYKVGP